MNSMWNKIGRVIYGNKWITDANIFSNINKIFKPSHEWEQTLYKTCGNIYWRFDGYTRVLSVAEKSLVLEVLLSRSKTVFTRRRIVSCGARWIDQVLSLTGDPDDSRIRKAMLPAFAFPFPMADMFFPLAQETSEKLIPAQGTPNIDEVVGTYIINATVRSLFNYEVRPEDMPAFINNAKSILTEGASWREFINIYVPPPIKRLLPEWSVFNRTSLNFFKDFAIEAQHERIELLNNLHDESEKPKDLLQLLLDARAEDELDDDEVIAQFLMVFIAGYDTNSSVIRCALAYLALHSEMQERLFKEVSELGEEINKFPDVDKLPYLEAVVKESLRKCPGAVTFERTAAKDHEFHRRPDIKVKKGQVVSIPNYCFNNDPAIFPNPDQFNPDRFLQDEKVEKRNRGPPTLFMPFGAGPRLCLGQPLALALIKVFLVVVVKKFEFRLPQGILPPFRYEEKQGQLKFKDVPVIFTKRQKNW